MEATLRLALGYATLFPQSVSVGGIAAHPCKKRKGGAPAVVLVGGGPTNEGGSPERVSAHSECMY